MKSLYQFRLLDELKASDTQVRISQLIGRKNEDGSLRDVEFQKETVVLQNGDGSVFEMAFASASGGVITFHKRGLDENNPPVEKAYNKKTWGNGTKCYVTAGAGDFIDKDEAQVWNGEQTFTGGVHIQKELKAEGQIDAKRGVKNPTFTTKEEATAYFTEVEKVEGLLVNIKGNTYRRNSITKSWEMLGIADINQEKVQENSTKISTLEEKMTTAEGKIEHLEEAGGNENFSKKGMIGGDYVDGDTLYMNRILQIYETSNQRSIVGSSYEKVYFIGMANGVGFDKISFPIYRLNNPMDGISLEIRNVVPHEGNSDIKHKPGQIVYATGQILPADIDTTAKMIEIILNAEVKLEKGALLAFVLKKNSPIYNNDQYLVPYGIMEEKGELGINCYMGINSNGLPVILGGGVSCVCSGIEQECYTKNKININTLDLSSDFRLNSGASNYVAQQELGNIRVGKYKTIVYVKYSNHSPKGNTFELQLDGVRIKQLPNPTASNNQIFDIGEIEIPTNGTLSIYCKMNTSSSGYYLQGYVSMNNVVGDDYEIEYIPEEVSPVGTMQKLIYYGMVKNQWKELYKKQGIIINKTVAVTSNGASATANWEAPSDGLLEVSWVSGGRYDDYYTETKINDKDLTHGWAIGSGGEIELKCYGRIFVKGGNVKIYCYKRYTNVNPQITLLSFIPL